MVKARCRQVPELAFEPTSAQAAAAFHRLLAAGTITPEQTTVLVLTGSGLKATPRIGRTDSVGDPSYNKKLALNRATDYAK